MDLKWTSKALEDVVRLHDFLAKADPAAAAATVLALIAAPDKLLRVPRLGEKLEEFLPREVRRILVGRYEMRYEIQQSSVFILRVWHTREKR